ncbi:MAG: S-layer homology domain-containing protein [Clostridiales Family XIII bacterium]|jgi:hypothetical protein|nr:S-layer homology domain-containing protein [Clostridiales Family XIII bacterium]
MSDKRRPAAAILCAALVGTAFGAGGPAEAAVNFVDTIGHWADEDIRAAVDYGYINGYPDGRFRPDAELKRSEFVKIVNAAMSYNSLGNIAFQDVTPDAWYYDEVRKAAAAGYIAGYDGGAWFAPENPITREETAMALYRVSPSDAPTKAPKGLKDSSSISSWALQAVASSYNKGYLSGFPDGNFYPQRNLTRAEAVKIVNKVLAIDPASRAITEMYISDLTDQRAIAEMTSRISGTLYWVVLNGGDGLPTPLQASQGKNALGDGAIQKGSVKVTAYSRTTVTITGLAAEKDYRLCAVVKGSDGKFSNISNYRFSTRSQASMGEDWLSSFNIQNVSQDTATLAARSDEKGTLYWVLVENSAQGTPSQTNIAAGNDADGDPAVKSGSMALQKNVSASTDVTGLKPGTRYYMYGYLSKSASEFSVVRSASFTTSGVSAPSISNFAAAFDNGGYLRLTFNVNASGKFYWIAVEESGNAVSMDASRVKNGTGNPGQKVADKGDSGVTQGAVTVTKSAFSMGDPLRPDVKYRIYACTEGAAGNLSSVVYSGILEKSTVAGGLNGLVLYANNKNLSLAFSQDKYDYDEIAVPNGAKTVQVRPSAASSADIILNGRIAANNANNSFAMPATSGTTATVVVEVSEAGKTKKIYTVPLRENVPEITAVYVSGAEPVNPEKDAYGNYAVTVPANYAEATMSVSFLSEMTGAVTLPVSGRVAVKSGERRKVTLDAQSTIIPMEVKGPAGETKTYTLTITKTGGGPPVTSAGGI